MRRFLFLLCSLLLLAVPALPAAEAKAEVKQKGADAPRTPPPIRRVTLYRDRAVVVRGGAQELRAGLNRLVFDALPAASQEVSLRARLDNPAAGRILNVTSWIDKRREIQDEKVRELDESIRAKQDLVRIASESLERYGVVLSYLSGYRSALQDAISKETLAQGPKVELWRGALNALTAKHETLGQQMAETAWRIGKEGTELGDLRTGLQQLENPAPRSVRMVEVLIEALKDGPADLELHYTMDRAGWQPLYEVQEDAAGAVRIVYRAGVWQRTDEDWEDVALSLSTAEPAVGASRPRLTALALRTVPRETGESSVRKVVDTRANEVMASTTPEDPAPATPPAGEEAVKIRGEATSFAFDLPGKVTVPRDGRMAKIGIAVSVAKEKAAFFACPELRPYVYRKLDAVNLLGVPLLPGAAELQHRGAYVGLTAMPYTAPGARFEISTGTDPEIETGVKIESEIKDRSGRGDRTYTKTFRLKNRKADPVAVTLACTVPVSEVREVTVELAKGGKFTEPSAHDEKKGELVWKLTLQPGEERNIFHQYHIVGPTEILDRQAIPVRQGAGGAAAAECVVDNLSAPTW